MTNIIDVLTSKMIRSDCEFLEQIQSAFPNVKIMLCDDITPYFHLYKNEDEAFSFKSDHFKEQISKNDHECIPNFNVDDKVAILINSIQLYLINKMYDETKEYILFYSGTYVTHNKKTIEAVEEYPEYVIDVYNMVTRLKLLEIK